MINVETLLADPLAIARTAAHPVGFVGVDVPLDVLTADGRTACHLPWDRRLATPRADAWLESGFAPWTRRILEDWAEGRFDLFEHVVFTRGDDSAQRLYYYVCELQARGEIRGPKPLIFDIAYIRRQASIERSRNAVATLCSDLAVRPGSLAIAAVNARRDSHARIQASRQGDGPAHERLIRASLFGEVAAPNMPAPAKPATRRILLAGTPPPDERLHVAVEQAGGSIVAEAHDRSPAWLGQRVAEIGDPVAAVADAIHSRTTGPRTFGNRGDRVVTAARAARANAVVLWLIEEEESEVWHVPAQRAALAAAGIPVLVLTRRSWLDEAAADISKFLAESAL